MPNNHLPENQFKQEVKKLEGVSKDKNMLPFSMIIISKLPFSVYPKLILFYF